MGTVITRREFVGAIPPAIGVTGVAVALSAGTLGCGVPDDAELDRRLVESLRRLAGGRAGSGTLSAEAGLGAEAALAVLRGDHSPRRLAALTWSAWLLRAFVDERRERDFREGRLRTVGGWLLAETEIAIAVLLGF